MGRRWIAAVAFSAAVGLSVVAIAHHASAQIETAPPGLETPIPTVAPVITPAPPVQTSFPTIPPINVAAAAGFGIVFFLIWLAVLVFFVIVNWRIFTKAGEPGWAAIVPIYNVIVLLKIAGKPWWWIFILWLIVPLFIAYIDLAHTFGKSTGFGVGLVLLSPIFFPILAFGSAQYQPRVSA